MTESSTLTDPRPVIIDYGCPDWCERDDHSADAHEAGEFASRYGPEFGVEVGIVSRGRELYVLLDFKPAAMEDDPQKLRELAANITLAAEWLESHR